MLGDALTRAGEESPELIIDFATLTGAARVALGPDLPALFANDEALAGRTARRRRSAAPTRCGACRCGTAMTRCSSRTSPTSPMPPIRRWPARSPPPVPAPLRPRGRAWAHLDTFAWRAARAAGAAQGRRRARPARRLRRARSALRALRRRNDRPERRRLRRIWLIDTKLIPPLPVTLCDATKGVFRPMGDASLTGWMRTLIDYVRSGAPDLTNRQMALLMLVYLTPGPAYGARAGADPRRFEAGRHARLEYAGRPRLSATRTRPGRPPQCVRRPHQ